MAADEGTEQHCFEHHGRSLTLKRNAEDGRIVGVFEDSEELHRFCGNRDRPLQLLEAEVRNLVDKGELMTPDEAMTHPPFGERMGPFTDQPNLDALAVQMFRQFSRFEYALKASGCLVREDGKAEANWDRLAGEIRTRSKTEQKVTKHSAAPWTI